MHFLITCVQYETKTDNGKQLTLEQPGVKAPGTANMSTLRPAHKSLVLTVLAGVSSYRSTLGNSSPTCQIIITGIVHAYHPLTPLEDMLTP